MRMHVSRRSLTRAQTVFNQVYPDSRGLLGKGVTDVLVDISHLSVRDDIPSET